MIILGQWKHKQNDTNKCDFYLVITSKCTLKYDNIKRITVSDWEEQLLITLSSLKVGNLKQGTSLKTWWIRPLIFELDV